MSSFRENIIARRDKYGMMPPPTADREALDELMRFFLSEDWHVVDPMNGEQATTVAVIDMEESHKCCMREGCPVRKRYVWRTKGGGDDKRD